MISPGVFFLFLSFSFFGLLGGKREKCSPKWKMITSVTWHISEKVYAMIMNFGTLVWNDMIFVFLVFFDISIFEAVREVKGQKMAPDDKKVQSVTLRISGTIYHMIVIYNTLVQNDHVSRCFFHFFRILIIWAVSSKMTKIRNQALGIIHHMIFIYGTHV